jgi:hypothetical protein
MAGTFLVFLLIAYLALTATGKPPAPVDTGPVPVPAAGQLYWGAWTDGHRTKAQPPWDMGAVAAIERQSGKGMSLLHFSTPFADRSGTNYFEFPAREFETTRAHGSIPFFSWSTHAMRSYRNKQFTLRAIIDGRHDAYIRRWATAAKAWGHPFFLRFNWEMNGDWFPWSERYGSNRAGEYVKAWRHVHQIFDAVGADNAAWVWCPAIEPYKDLQPLKTLYPGRAYVDWTCMDGYNSYPQWKTFSNLFGSMYRQITTNIAPGKPMIIGETASTETGGSKPGWIAGMFTSIRQDFPAIRGLIYFDKDTRGPGGRRRLPLDSSAASIAAMARAVDRPWVLSNTFQSLKRAPTSTR